MITQKVPLYERLEKLLQTNEFTIHTTRSALDELNSLPGETFQEARQFGLDECEIIERCYIPDSEPDSNPKQDIQNLVRNGNADMWFVATQDEGLSDKIRGYVNVPQLRLARAVLILESPSASSRKQSTREEQGKQRTGGGTMTNDERELIQRMRDERRQKHQPVKDDDQQRSKRKAKGPNPLSCKKKKSENDAVKSDGKKRSRSRSKKATGVSGP